MNIAATLAMLGVFATSSLAAQDLSSRAAILDDARDTALRAEKKLDTKSYDEAAGLYRVIIQDHPDCLYAWFHLGITRLLQRRFDDAHDAFTHAIALNPKDEASLVDIALVENYTNNSAGAVKHLQAAIALDPNNSRAHAILADSYKALGRHDDAQAEKAKADMLERKEALRNLVL
jgi:cytochrome c-type biogenesis protein CcmH/NrfG